MKRIISLFAAALLFSACPGGDDEGGGSAAPLCPEPEVLSGHITTEFSVGEECRNVVSQNGVTVAQGGVLRIAPGTTITFGSGAGLMVHGGTLIAAGTAGAPIVFTGEETVPGYWQGLTINQASSTQNVIDHVVVESAGGSKYAWARVAGGLVILGEDGKQSRIRVTNSLFHRNKGVGVAIHEHSIVSTFSGNELTENVEGAAYSHITTASQLTPDNVYTGNQIDRVNLDGNDLKTEVTLHNLGVPFRTEMVNVLSGGKLSLVPGVRVRFAANGHFEMRDGGRFEAIGTASDPIVFEGDETAAGFWRGLVFYTSPSTENVLDHVIVTDAGGSKHAWASQPASVVLANPEARLQMSNTIIDRGQGFALYIDPRAEITRFSQNTLTGHTLGPVHAGPQSARSLSSDSSYVGNATGRDHVVITNDDLRAESTWKTIDVPYLVRHLAVRDGGALTIEPGNIVKFQANGGLESNNATALISAVGTASAPILFTRADDAVSWKGFHVNSSTMRNRLEHVEIAFGGDSKYVWAENAAAVSVYNGRLELANVRITNSAANGLDISTHATVTGCDSVIYEGTSGSNQSGNGSCD